VLVLDNANPSLIYELLSDVNRSFDEILVGLESIQKSRWFRERQLIQTVELAVRETQAWTTFEILEVLHERVEREWTRLGRLRSRREKQQNKNRSGKRTRK
jgi:hypothetical protein